MKVKPIRQVALRRDRSAAAGGSVANSFPLMLTAVLLLHVAVQDGSSRPWVEWVDLVMTLGLASAAYVFFRWLRGSRTASDFEQQHRDQQPSKREKSLVARGPRDTQLTTHGLPSLFEFGFLLLFALLPFVTDAFTRQFADHGNPWEIKATLAMRNLMFGLLVVPRADTARLAIFLSLFIALFSALVTISTATNVLLAIYALLGLWWLMGNYWRRISAYFPTESTIEIPYFARAGAVMLVLFCLAGGALAFQSEAVTSAFAGLMPSSGGTGGNDPFARGGVGDGDQMVGAKDDASSFGPIESELFLESKQPTLYDMFIENYEPPSPRRRTSRARAIPLAPNENQKQNHTKLAQNKKANREFSAVRRQSKNRQRRKDLKDLQSQALLYVAGRTPLHLKLAIYDHWDGRTLSLRNEQAEPLLRLAKDNAQRNWATWNHLPYDQRFAAAEPHVLKMINLRSAVVPAPPNMTGTHIDKLHEAGFFRWEDGMLRLRGDRFPSLTVLHVKSHPLRRSYLADLRLRRPSPKPLADGPERAEGEIAPRLEQLARAWTDRVDSDWQHVQAICAHLRELEHDPAALVPEDTNDAVEAFLFDSQRGPDYLFATSAAVLLRSLGYHARVVSGLYADPENYDRLAKATGVFANNVHFWAEVQTEEGQWIPVEPTPGFRLLYGRQTLLERASLAMTHIAQGVMARPGTYGLLFLAVVGMVVFRKAIHAWIATCWWKLRLQRSPRKQVLHSVWLLQQLTKRRKSGRRAGQTLDQWLATLGRSSDTPAIVEFRALVSWACYASSDDPVTTTSSVRQVCLDSVRLLKERV